MTTHTGICARCGHQSPELTAPGLCVGCFGAATEIVIGALEDAPTPLTRPNLTAALASKWPELPNLTTVARLVLMTLIDQEAVEEISPGRFRLVPDGQA